MPSEEATGSRRPYRVLANLGLIVTALWLLAYLMPAGRTMMLDTILAFLLGALVTGLLWWAAYQALHPRRLWTWLAAAWTVGLLLNVAWEIYELASGQLLPRISVIGSLYLVRYVLVLVAFWQGLDIPARRQWGRLLVVLVAATAVVLAAFFLSAPASRWTALWLAAAIYPVLDVGLLYLALEAWLQEPAGRLRKALGLVTLALIAYGAANWFNFFGQVLDLDPVTGLAALFWPLCDILIGIAVLYLFWLRAPAE
jgi:hypothetical protein